MRILLGAALLVPVPGAGIAQTAPTPAPLLTRTVALLDGAGGSAGSVMLTEAPKGVLLHVDATGLTPGWHAIHFHEKANCSDAMFKMAGGHVHDGAHPVHGLLNPSADDEGDLPNIHADAGGQAQAELFSTMVALRPGTPRANLLDADGSAIVIHANKDDYRSQPIGGAGDRKVCGVIK